MQISQIVCPHGRIIGLLDQENSLLHLQKRSCFNTLFFINDYNWLIYIYEMRDYIAYIAYITKVII